MVLDFSSLKKALESLSNAISSTENETFMASLTYDQRKTMRSGVIQNFEFSYELAWKMLRRQLKAEEGASVISVLSRKDLYRLAAQKEIIADPEAWFAFHHARNQTSHTYDEDIAQEVYCITLIFLPVAQCLYANLEKRQS